MCCFFFYKSFRLRWFHWFMHISILGVLLVLYLFLVHLQGTNDYFLYIHYVLTKINEFIFLAFTTN
jgi:hypothetical protein